MLQAELRTPSRGPTESHGFDQNETAGELELYCLSSRRLWRQKKKKERKKKEELTSPT